VDAEPIESQLIDSQLEDAAEVDPVVKHANHFAWIEAFTIRLGNN